MVTFNNVLNRLVPISENPPLIEWHVLSSSERHLLNPNLIEGNKSLKGYFLCQNHAEVLDFNVYINL